MRDTTPPSVPTGAEKEYSLRGGIIRLPRSKSGRSRQIPINSVLRKTLLAIPRTTSPYVFEGTDPGKWLAKALQKARIKNFHWLK